MEVLTEHDVARLLTLDDALDAVEHAFTMQPDETGVLPRRRLHMGRTRLQVLAGSWIDPPRLTVKAYTSGENSCVILFDGNGELLAVIEARLLSMYRTGAATGVATKYLSRPDCHRLGILGSGYQAIGQLLAVCSVRPITEVRVWSRTLEHTADFASRMSDEIEATIEPVDHPEDATEDRDIVITVTKSVEPVLAGSRLSPGTHVNLVGANQLHRREADDAVLARSRIVVVDDLAQARPESGEIVHSVEAGVLGWEELVELGDIVRGDSPGRRDPGDITVFKSLGIGLEDVAVASRVYQRAAVGR